MRGEYTSTALHQPCNPVICQQMSRKLHEGVGFAKVTPASGVAALRSGRKAGGLSWALGAVCWPATSTVWGKLSTGVHTESNLINSAAHKAACLVNSDLCLWAQGVSWFFYLCFTWCGSWEALVRLSSCLSPASEWESAHVSRVAPNTDSDKRLIKQPHLYCLNAAAGPCNMLAKMEMVLVTNWFWFWTRFIFSYA